MSTGHYAMSKILEILKQKDLSLADFARLMNVLSVHVSNWKRRGIPLDRLPQVADVLNVSIDYLTGRNNSLPENAVVLSLSGQIPVIGEVSLSDDGYFTEIIMKNSKETLNIQSSDKQAYALECTGSELMPRIQPGEYVIAEPGREASPGDEVVIQDNSGKVLIKRFLFIRNGNYYFGSINADQKNTIIPTDQIKNIHPILAIVQNRFLNSTK